MWILRFGVQFRAQGLVCRRFEGRVRIMREEMGYKIKQ